jgi:hypothetical protein
MKNNHIGLLTFKIMIIATPNTEARLTLQEIRTASKDVLVAYSGSDTLDLNKVNISNLED